MEVITWVPPLACWKNQGFFFNWLNRWIFFAPFGTWQTLTNAGKHGQFPSYPIKISIHLNDQSLGAMNQVINGGCHASRNWNAHRSAPQKVQWHGQSDAPIALVPLTKVAESASHFIVTSPHIPFLQTHIKIKDQGLVVKVLERLSCCARAFVSLFMMNQGTRGTWGCRFYNVNVAKACRNEEKTWLFWRPIATYRCLFQQETELHIAPDKETLWFIACCVSWIPWKMMPFSFSEKSQFDDNCVNFTWKKTQHNKTKGPLNRVNIFRWIFLRLWLLGLLGEI